MPNLIRKERFGPTHMGLEVRSGTAFGPTHIDLQLRSSTAFGPTNVELQVRSSTAFGATNVEMTAETRARYWTGDTVDVEVISHLAPPSATKDNKTVTPPPGVLRITGYAPSIPSTYLETFGSYAIGTAPTTLEAQAASATLSVEADTARSDGKVLRMTNPVAQDMAYRYAPAGQFADGQAMAAFYYLKTQNGAHRVYGRMGGGTGTLTAYLLNTANDNVRIDRYVNGSFLTLATVSIATFTDGTFTWMRLELAGTTIRGKIWQGTANNEPTAWTISATDTAITSGAVGIGGYRNSTVDYGFISSAVGAGKIAPKPSGASSLSWSDSSWSATSW